MTVITTSDLSQIRDSTEQRIVLAFGTFDLIHPGHVSYLEWAKSQGNILVVTLKSDEQVRAHKGQARPITAEADRVRIVAALKPVDYALIGAEGGLFDAAVLTAKFLHPDLVALGPDWGEAVKADWLQALPDAQVIVAPPTVSTHSTTEIIAQIQ